MFVFFSTEKKYRASFAKVWDLKQFVSVDRIFDCIKRVYVSFIMIYSDQIHGYADEMNPLAIKT